MKRMLMSAVAATVVLGAGGAPASAAGTELCVGEASAALLSPDRDGQCKRGYTLTSLADQADLAALEARVSALESENSALKSSVTTLQGRVAGLESTLSKVSYDAAGVNGRPTLTISGANVQIVNGTGYSTQRNGLGNLFVGYNQHAVTDEQSGSHNVVIGDEHSFTSTRGLIGGADNTLTATGSAVLGLRNTASGDYASVVAGSGNVASASFSSVSGGYNNTASGPFSSIQGGGSNTAGGDSSSVSGGLANLASGVNSSILGGYGHTAATTNATAP